MQEDSSWEITENMG